MIKKFCDLCEQPATTKELRRECAAKFGRPYISFRTDGPASGKIQTLITVSAGFGFRDHESGFGGPPDLCEACAAKLVKELGKLYGVKS